MKNYNCDTLATRLIGLGRQGAILPPAWDGAKIAHLVAGPQGEFIGKLLPGKGLLLFDDLKHYGITSPLPWVFERSLTFHLRDLLKSERGAITTLAGLQSARGSFKSGLRSNPFSKTLTVATSRYSSIFTSTGTPSAGAYTAITGGAAHNQTTTGALNYGMAQPTNPDKAFLMSLGLGSPSIAINSGCLIDILVGAGNIDSNVNTAQTVNTTALTRHTTGAGVVVFFEVTSALSSGASNLTINKYCVDPATECLTRRGWKQYTELTAQDEILAYDQKAHTTRWERPKEIFTLDKYCGDMMLLGDEELSALTTLDHRWPILKQYGRKKQLRRTVATSETLPHYGFIPRSAPYADAPTHKVHSDAFVRIVAWYVTDGSMRRGGHELEIGQSVSANAPYVSSLRNDMLSLKATQGLPLERGDRGRTIRTQGLRFREYLRKDGMIDFFLSGTGTDEIVAAAPGKDKVPTMEFLLSLTRDQLQIFLDTMLCGDGTPSKRLFYQHHPARMDAYMVAAVLAGYSPTLDVSGSCCALNGWKRGHGKARICLDRLKRQTLYYQGPIWCPVTQSGHWIARRRGKVFITGNTNQAGTTLQASAANTMVVSAAVTVLPYSTLTPFFGLAAGDYGVRSVEEVTFSAAMGGTGRVAVVLCMPLMWIPALPLGFSAKRDDTTNINGAKELAQTSGDLTGCLSLLINTSGSGAVVYNGDLEAAVG